MEKMPELVLLFGELVLLDPEKVAIWGRTGPGLGYLPVLIR